MGKLRKIGKKIARGIRKVGRKLKKGLGKIAKAFGKLGPIGSLALSFILPGIGGQIFNFLKDTPFVGKIFEGINYAVSGIKSGVGKVFNKVTDAIEWGMNSVSKSGTAGSTFRDWVSNTTGGFIKPSAETEYDQLTAGDTLFDTEKVTDTDTVVDVAASQTDKDRKRFLDGLKDKDTGIKAAWKGSEEQSVFRKSQAVSTFGQTLQAQEDAAIAAKEQLDDYNSQQASSYASELLNLTNTRILDPVSFVNYDAFTTSQTPAQTFLKNALNILTPSEDEALKLAPQIQTYGAQLSYIGGGDD